MDLFQAYFDARRNKRNTINQLEFEMDFEHNLFVLAEEIRDRTYSVGRSICFIVNNPVKREIFAADFRDRVVHHLIFNRVNHIFDSKLIRDCYSCRKGKGTSDGIERLEHHIRSVTNNHTREAWVLKLDIRGYFMSIDRRLLWEKIEKTIKTAMNKGELARLEETLYLLRLVVFNDPTEDCIVKGNRKTWEGLPPSKSLFHSPEGCGLPIGNLTSQMFSNIYLSDFDNWVKRELKIKHYGRYVDDFYFLHRDKEVLLRVRDMVFEYMWTNCGLTVHPNKIYLQKLEHGVTFLGAHVKPFRKYVRSRTLGTIRNNLRKIDVAIREMNRQPDRSELDILRSRFNSYLGYLGQFKTYHIREGLWNESEGYRKFFYIGSDYRKITVKSKYRPHMAEGLTDDGSTGLPPLEI